MRSGNTRKTVGQRSTMQEPHVPRLERNELAFEREMARRKIQGGRPEVMTRGTARGGRVLIEQGQEGVTQGRIGKPRSGVQISAERASKKVKRDPAKRSKSAPNWGARKRCRKRTSMAEAIRGR